MRCLGWFQGPLAATMLLVAGAAHGQEAPELRLSGEDEVIQEPPKEETSPPDAPLRHKRKSQIDSYAPIGLPLGGLRLFPSVTLGGVVSSNIRRSSSGAEAGAGVRLKPSLRFESDWVRHSWTGEASGDFIRYIDNGDVASDNAGASSRFRLDIRHETFAEFETSYNFDQTGLENSDVPSSAVGYRDEHTGVVSAALSHDFMPMQLRLKAIGTRKIFGDVALRGGGSEDNSDRDYVEPGVSFRTTYTDPPVLKPFVEIGYDRRIHDRKSDRSGLERSSDGYSVRAGFALDDGPIWTGELAAVYLSRDYDDQSLNSNDAVGLVGNMTWSPTELTKVVFGAGTSLTDSVSPTSSGSRTWTGNIEVRQAVRENVELLAGAGIELQREESGSDVTYDANLGIEWKWSPAIAWTAAYDATWLDAANASRSYSDHRFSLGVILSR